VLLARAGLLAVTPAAASAAPPRDGRLAFGTCDSVSSPVERPVLWRVRSDGSHLRSRVFDRVLGLPCYHPTPVWSPNGRLLATHALL
jgi:hypothetical protein